MVKKKDIEQLVTGSVPESFKFDQVGPDDKKLDFEMMGRVLDNILIVAEQDNKQLTEGKDYTIEFDAACKAKYTANLHVFKKYIQFTVTYVRDLTKLESRNSKMRKDPPKVKKEIDAIVKKSKEDAIKRAKETIDKKK